MTPFICVFHSTSRRASTVLCIAMAGLTMQLQLVLDIVRMENMFWNASTWILFARKINRIGAESHRQKTELSHVGTHHIPRRWLEWVCQKDDTKNTYHWFISILLRFLIVFPLPGPLESQRVCECMCVRAFNWNLVENMIFELRIIRGIKLARKFNTLNSGLISLKH